MLRIVTSCSWVDNELQLNQNQSIVLQCCSNRRYSPLTRKEWRVNRLRECEWMDSYYLANVYGPLAEAAFKTISFAEYDRKHHPPLPPGRAIGTRIDRGFGLLQALPKMIRYDPI